MKRIITISREFGSGGRSIGKALAERLGYAYYDKEIVKDVAAQTGFNPTFIEERGEFSASRSPLTYIFDAPGSLQGMSTSDFLWCIQREVILKLADKEPCIIVGRCADYILRDRKDVLNVFVHAPMEYRAERIVKLYGESEKSPEQRLKDKDKRRRNNYKHYTDQEWGMAQNYHITLDTAKIGIDTCVDILEKLAKEE